LFYLLLEFGYGVVDFEEKHDHKRRESKRQDVHEHPHKENKDPFKSTGYHHCHHVNSFHIKVENPPGSSGPIAQYACGKKKNALGQ
jgi:hypothetical protein